MWIVMEIRKQIRKRLSALKNDFGAVFVKAEFEAEGSRKDELIMLREMAEAADLGLIIKIGGCEALHDLEQCKLLSASGVMAPMIETPYALDKFRGAVTRLYGQQTQIECIINAETITCLQNFDAILEHGKGFLTGVTVGRSDLSASMGIAGKEIEGDVIFSAAKEFCEKAGSAGLVTNFGGNIGMESIPFIRKMNPYIDRFETRKVILHKNGNAEFLKQAIAAALEFELLYLRFKSQYYTDMANEDAVRVKRLEAQINAAREN